MSYEVIQIICARLARPQTESRFHKKLILKKGRGARGVRTGKGAMGRSHRQLSLEA